MPRDEVPRRPRYPVQLAMRYRLGQERTWRQGETRDVSATGVLFDAEGPPPEPSAAIEMNLLMPPEIVASAATHVVCVGKVVRVVPASRPAVAATIARYRLTRRERGSKES